MFEGESGGHRWQAISGKRIHTSTITVAVLDLETAGNSSIREDEVEFIATRGSGPGGQHRNKVETCIVATHKPTGISVRIDTRSQYHNKRIALQVLNARIAEMNHIAKMSQQNSERKNQIGAGMRGDKVRTYREKDNQVVDHRTNAKWQLSRWIKGDW